MAEDILRRAPLLAAVDEESATEIIGRMRAVDLARGDRLFHEGDPGDALYVIESGKIKLARRAADGRENLLAILGPGEMFGELSLFDPGPRVATAVAVSGARVHSLTRDDFVPLLDQPRVALSLLAALGRRLRRTNEALADLVFSDVPGRVAKALLDLSTRFGRPVEDGVLVAHDLTQEGWPSSSGRAARP